MMEYITKDKSNNFPNLVAELARINMSKPELAVAIGMSVSTMYGKFKGDTDWTLDDMDAIKAVLESRGCKETSLDYLFGRGQ